MNSEHSEQSETDTPSPSAPNTVEASTVSARVPDPAPDAANGVPEITIEATYRAGVICLDAPLDLPDDTPLSLRVRQRAPDPAGDASASAPEASETSTSKPAALAALDDMPRSRGPHPWLLLPLAAALVLGGMGQSLFLQHGTFTWTGLLLYLVAVLMLGVGFVLSGHPLLRVGGGYGASLLRMFQHTLPRQSWRLGALVAAVALTVVLLYVLQIHPPLESYNWTALLWVAAVGLYMWGVAPVQRPPQQATTGEWWQQWRAHWWLPLLVATIVLAGLGLRVWHLGTIPETLGGDEGSQGLEALRVLQGELRHPFTTGWLGVPTMSFYFNALSIGSFGNTIFALRLPWALIGTATVMVVFLLVKRLQGLTMALVTAALLATYHYHIHFSRLGSIQVSDTFFVALSLLFLYRAYDRRSALDWALCGVVVGVAQFFYAGARFTAVVVCVVVFFLALRDGMPFVRQRYREVLVLVGAMLLTSAPMIQFAVRFPNDYNARVNEVGIVQSGWLANEQALRGEGPLPILFEQAKRSFLAFNFYGDRNVWYGTQEPLMDDVAGVLFVLGVGIALLHMFNRRMFPMVAWWGGATILGGVLTESPPSSQRLITLAVPAIFFVALAVVTIGRIVAQSFDVRQRARVLVPYLVAVVLALSIISLKWYFVDFTPQRLYGGYNGVVATSIGKYARDELGDDWRMYFFGPPRMYIGFATIPYLAPDVEGTDMIEPLTRPPGPDMVRADKGAVFIFLPERRTELDLVQQLYPDGELDIVPSPVPNSTEPLYVIYRVPREELERVS